MVLGVGFLEGADVHAQQRGLARHREGNRVPPRALRGERRELEGVLHVHTVRPGAEVPAGAGGKGGEAWGLGVRSFLVLVWGLGCRSRER